MMATFQSFGRLATVALLASLLAGCSSQPSPSSSAAHGATGGKAAAGAVKPSESADSAADGSAPVSVFNLGPKRGRDPFFAYAAPAASEQVVAVPEPQLPLISYLKLVGIRPGTSRPMALINRTPFSPGEEGPVSIVVSNHFSGVEVQKVNIRCLEVRRDSVLISIAGEQGVKELRMAQAK